MTATRKYLALCTSILVLTTPRYIYYALIVCYEMTGASSSYCTMYMCASFSIVKNPEILHINGAAIS